jgi:hypothetical protein
MNRLVRDSSVGIVMSYRLEGRGIGVRSTAGARSSLQNRDRLWDPTSRLSSGYLRFFLRDFSGRQVDLTISFHLILRLRIRESIPPFRQYVFTAWCLIKDRNIFNFLPSTLAAVLSQMNLIHILTSY